jgi:hypothetical protein
MFANYRYSAILRKVSPSSAPEPKNDPILIGDLQGVSGLEDDEIEKGYFSKSSEMGFYITSQGGYESKTLTFSGDSWTGNGELIPTPIERSYSNNVDGTFLEPNRIDGIKNSFQITNTGVGGSGNLVSLYDIHIENVNKGLPQGRKVGIGKSQIGIPTLVRNDPKQVEYTNIVPSQASQLNQARISILGHVTYEESYNLITTTSPDQIFPIRTPEVDKLADNTNNNSLSDYATMTYQKIIEKQDGTITGDFRKFVRDPNKLKDGTGAVIKLVGKPSVEQRAPNSGKDFVNLSIQSISTGNSVNFTTFLTSFNDSFSPSWGDIKYVGRQDTLKYFTGVTRTVGLGFKLAAFKKQDLGIIYGKLSTLIKGSAVGGVNKGGKIITAPVSKLTFGSWFYQTPCVITSMKFDVQATEYSWDIDSGMPHLVDVSLDFFILGDVTGNALDSKSNNYFRYTIS